MERAEVRRGDDADGAERLGGGGGADDAAEKNGSVKEARVCLPGGDIGGLHFADQVPRQRVRVGDLEARRVLPRTSLVRQVRGRVTAAVERCQVGAPAAFRQPPRALKLPCEGGVVQRRPAQRVSHRRRRLRRPARRGARERAEQLQRARVTARRGNMEGGLAEAAAATGIHAATAHEHVESLH